MKRQKRICTIPRLPQSMVVRNYHFPKMGRDLRHQRCDCRPIIRKDRIFHRHGKLACPYPLHAKFIGLHPIIPSEMDCSARAIYAAKSFASGVTAVCFANSRIHNTMPFVNRVLSFPTESGLITRLKRNPPNFKIKWCGIIPLLP
jgi:hypothetical protein